MAYISFDPWHQRENARFDTLSDLQLNNIVDEVYRAWDKWRNWPLEERSALLEVLGKLLIEESSKHGKTITSEIGKTISQATSEVEKCATACFYYSNNLERLLAPEKRASSSGEGYVRYEPQGIILGIMPWNFPYWQAFRFIIPVIAGGNTVLLKHASNVPLCSESIEKIILKAGFPENIVRNIFADYSQVEKVISRPEVRGVSLTGSSEAGKKIASVAGSYLKKTVMELGGSDPLIVLKDADLEAASDAAVFSRFQNCGQSCIATKRIFVQSGIFDKFLSLLVEKVRQIRIGDPYDSETFIGPMVSENALNSLQIQVEKTIAMGAKILTGGKRHYADRPVYAPTVVIEIPEASPVVAEETFGPVVPVMKFDNVEDIIADANRTEYGLGASLWTRDLNTGLRLASSIDAGIVAINGFVRSDPPLPFGGVKNSGYGRELSDEGFREFLNTKTVTVFH
jgi:succinate-semialdehyde dehydrogenase/glutarate-semialdehyde dehydrogenase